MQFSTARAFPAHLRAGGASVRSVGFLDRAKKLAEQAKGVAEQAKEAAEGALSEARSRTGAAGPDEAAGGGGASGGQVRRDPPPPAGDPRMGTSYVPGMLGRPGWREQGLADPAAVLPIAERDRAGVPHSTRSEITEEPYGMGRRWTADGRAVGLFYQLHPDHRAWEPEGGRSPVAEIAGGSQATLGDGRSLLFLGAGDRRVVLETDGIDDSARSDLAHAVARQLAPG